MKKNNVYIINLTLNGKQAYNVINPIYYYLKEYYEDNSDFASQWQWEYLVDKSFEECREIFDNNPPAVIGLSTYIWNFENTYKLAEQIKQAYPNAKIVAGGPQVAYDFEKDFFEKNSFIDYTIAGQGEHTFSLFLDYYYCNKDLNTVPGIIYFNNNQVIQNSSDTNIKKQTVWNNNWVSKYKNHIKQQIEIGRLKNVGNISIIYETTRGCPYQCTYCDWGGGTYTKVKKKPLEIIKSEIDVIAELEIDLMDLGDANFGMYPIDVEIAEYIVETNKKTGYPKSIRYDQSKNNIDRNMQIVEIFVAAKMMYSAQLAFQDINKTVLSDIKRTIPDWKQQIDKSLVLSRKYGVTWGIDMIFGLPGQTVDSMIDTLTKIYTSCSNEDLKYFELRYNHLQILPNATIVKEPNFSKQQIRYKNLNMLHRTYPLKAKTMDIYNSMINNGVRHVSKPIIIDKGVSITGSYSFDEHDLGKIHLLGHWISTMNTSGVLGIISDFVDKDDYQILVRTLLENVIDRKTTLGKIFDPIVTNYRDWLLGKKDSSDIDFGDDWDMTVNLMVALFYLTNLHIDIILDEVKILTDRMGYNLKFHIEWIKNIYIGINYKPGKVFEGTNPYTNVTGRWQLRDTSCSSGTDSDHLKISWHRYRNDVEKKQNFLMLTSTEPGYRLAQQIHLISQTNTGPCSPTGRGSGLKTRTV